MGQNGILWILDIGIINTLEEKPKRECEAKILGIESGSGRVSIKKKKTKCLIYQKLDLII